MSVTLWLKPFLRCPACNKHDFEVQHVMERPPGEIFGPWYCEACGVGIKLVRVPTGIDVAFSGDRRVRCSVLLKIEPKPKPIYLLVRGMRFEGGSRPAETLEEFLQHKRYFYEEHTCPTNFLGDVVDVFYDGDVDPHGLALFCGGGDGESAAGTVATEGPPQIVKLVEQHESTVKEAMAAEQRNTPDGDRN